MKRVLSLFLAMIMIFSLSVSALADNNEYLTKGRLCTLVAQHYDLDLSSYRNNYSFTDLSTEDENYDAIIACLNAGIVASRDQNTFEPEAVLTRAKVAKVLKCAYEYKFGKYNDSSIANPAADVQNKDEWFYTFVKFAVNTKIMVVDVNNNFRPNDFATEDDIIWNTNAPTVVDSGIDGSITWTLYSDGKLAIGGSGYMSGYEVVDRSFCYKGKYNDYSDMRYICISNDKTQTEYVFSCTSAPYAKYLDIITSVEIGDFISVGSNAFYGLQKLSVVSVGYLVNEVSEDAFTGCNIQHVFFKGPQNMYSNVYGIEALLNQNTIAHYGESNFTYTINANGTHTRNCSCGTETEAHNYVLSGIDSTSHTLSCDCGINYTEKHTWVTVGSETYCLGCGTHVHSYVLSSVNSEEHLSSCSCGDKSFEKHCLKIASDDDLTHTISCDCGYSVTQDHSWVQDELNENIQVCSVCGLIHEHEYTYVSNGDETHTGTCSCGKTVSESHNWEKNPNNSSQSICKDCGATKQIQVSDIQLILDFATSIFKNIDYVINKIFGRN